MPQGNLAERIRAAGAGIGGLLHPDRLRHPARRGQGDPRDRRPALRAGATRSTPTSPSIKAHRGRRHGQPRSTARRPATSGRSWPRPRPRRSSRSHEVVPVGELDPEVVVTPGIYVDRVVVVPAARPPSPSRASELPQSPSTLEARAATRRLAALVARDIPHGAFVNLGIGQPTLVVQLPRARTATSRSTPRTACSAWARRPHGDEVDRDLINAGKIPVTELPGASYFHHADSLRDDARRPPRHLRARRLPGLGDRRPRQLAHRRAGRDPRRRRRHGPRHRRQGRPS